MSSGKVTPLPEARFAPLPPTNQHQGERIDWDALTAPLRQRPGGAVPPTAAASAPGGPISETVVPARGDVIPAGSVGVMGHLFPIRKVCVGHAYARNGNAHNPTPRYEWQAEVNGRWIGHDATRRSLVELLWIGVESGEFVPAGAA